MNGVPNTANPHPEWGPVHCDYHQKKLAEIEEKKVKAAAAKQRSAEKKKAKAEEPALDI